MKLATIILNIILIIALFPAGMGAMMSPMMFDAPGSTKNSGIWLAAISAVALPFTIIVCELLSWWFFSKGNYALAFKISLIPVLINVGLMGFGLTFMGK